VPLAANLGAGELAINYADGKLFYKDGAAAIQVIGWKTTPTTAGGTGLTSYTAGDLPYYASGSALSKLAIGTSGYVLQSNGSAPVWVAQSTLSVGSATNATNTAITDNTSSSATWYPTIVSATTGNLPQTTSSTKLSFVPSTGLLSSTSHAITGTLSANGSVGTAGQVLTSNGSSAAYWANASVGGISWQSVQTSNFTAAIGNAYPVNTTSSAITVTLPASPSAGNYVQITDYAGTFATNNVTINPNGNKLDGSTNNVLMVTNRETIAFVYIDSTQGWIPYSGFNTSTPTGNYNASYLIVGGGAGGDWGGGGAGGLLSGTVALTPGTTYTATVGSGGSGGLDNVSGGAGSSGGNSSFTSIGTTALGGGGGAGYASNSTNRNGVSGGSGGGASRYSGGGTGGSGTSGQGNAGGNGTDSAPYYGSGGGGGASAVGANSTSSAGGNGGAGTASSITGSSVIYAGGGGGAAQTGGTQGTGGSGGGGNAGAVGGTAGTANTGGGGGGTSSANLGFSGGNGGSGVVIISVPTANYTGTTTGSPTVTTSGSNTIMKFTSSGSYTA